MPEKEKKTPILERYGLRYFSYLSRKSPVKTGGDEIHVLNHEERKALIRVERASIARQAVAGGISAGLSVLIGFWLWPHPNDLLIELTLEETLHYYALLYPITFGVTAIEIAYLYYDSLRSVHKLSTMAGLNLFPEADQPQNLTVSLVRAALEMPNPPDGLEGINPRREISRLELLFAVAIYKLKATATNFILKAFLRRMAGRSALRPLMEFVAVPVFAFWNGLIAYWVLREARTRAMGPSAVEEYSSVLFEDADQRSPEAHLGAFRAIGAAIVRTVDLHPNLILLMEATERHLGDPGEATLDDSELFVQSVLKLSEEEQSWVLRVFVVASMIDGRLVRRERRLLRDIFQRCGYDTDLTAIQRLRSDFVKGNDIVKEAILNCLPQKNPNQR